MKYVLFTVLVAVSFVYSVFCSEQPQVSVFNVRVGDGDGVNILSDIFNNNNEKCFYADVPPIYHLLCYSDSSNINFLKDKFDIHCDDSEPFIRIQYLQTHPHQEVFKTLYIDPITSIPLKCFLVGDMIKKEGNVFKDNDSTLLSFPDLDKKAHIKLHTDLKEGFGGRTGDAALEDLLQRFKQTALIQWDPLEKHELLKTELLKKNIVAYDSDRIIIHGPKGYFGEPIKTEQTVQEQALFYSRLKKLFGCSVAIIIMYALYKQFYATR